MKIVHKRESLRIVRYGGQCGVHSVSKSRGRLDAPFGVPVKRLVEIQSRIWKEINGKHSAASLLRAAARLLGSLPKGPQTQRPNRILPTSS